MTPAAALATLANCASAAVTPAIGTLVVGPKGIGDEVPCCVDGSIVVELDAFTPAVPADERDALHSDCPSEDVLRATIIVSRCVETLRKSKGYSGGGAPTTATFNAEGAALLADATATYTGLKCCINDLFDAGDIEGGSVSEAQMNRGLGCARVSIDVVLTIPMPCTPTP